MSDNPDWTAHNLALANEFAEKGTLKYFLITRGFLPDNEKVAEAILDNIIKENEDLRWEIEKRSHGLT